MHRSLDLQKLLCEFFFLPEEASNIVPHFLLQNVTLVHAAEKL